MLKTLRITSLIALVLAVCGVLFIVFWGLREDPAIIAYLDNPGVIKQFEDQVSEEGEKELESPLVAQAHAFALRIDPPPPPKPPTPVNPKPEPVKTVQRVEPPKPRPPQPPAPKKPVNAKFTLLATVQCESDPSRSMVLLRQTGGKDEWFWQGERVGHLDIDEVRDGSAIFSQNGRNPQELFVPAKPLTKSLLKAETTRSRTAAPGSTSINVLVDAETGEPVTTAAAVSSDAPPQTPGRLVPDRSARIERDRNVLTTSAEVREEVSSRIRRIRTVPKPPTPAEQQASIDESISSIQAIMNREDGGIGEEQQKKENEAWMKLLTALQSEKENLPVAEEETTKQDETSQADDEAPSDTDSQPNDPNEKSK